MYAAFGGLSKPITRRRLSRKKMLVGRCRINNKVELVITVDMVMSEKRRVG